MKAKINIPTITSASLRDKKYLKIFSEFYKLSGVIENSPWHHKQKALDHAIAVFAELETVLQFKNLGSVQASKLKAYLAKRLGNRTREEVLKVATLLHDIAKSDTLVKEPDGSTRCPGHELIGAGRVKNFAQRFGLGSKDQEYVERIVKYHGLISEFLSLIMANDSQEKYLKMFQETVGDVAIELVLFMEADLSGSDLGKSDKKGLTDRVNILSWMLKRLLSL